MVSLAQCINDETAHGLNVPGRGQKNGVLYLSADPSGDAAGKPLRTGKEAREIEEAIRGSRYRDQFELKTRFPPT
jgi:hypothetical protein